MINRSSAFVIGSYVAGCIARANSIPSAGETVVADSFLIQPGGKGFNLMAGLHRLRAEVDGILPVGDDLWGRMSPLLFDELGLPKSWLLPMTGPSGGAVGLTDHQGENRIAVNGGVNSLVGAADIEPLWSRLFGACIVAGQFEVTDEALLCAFSIGRQGGARTLLNPSPFRPVKDALLALTDIIIVNETEARQLAADLGIACAPGHSAQAFRGLAEGLHRLGVGTVIVTVGAGGAFGLVQGRPDIFQPAYPVQTRDTTGAGDAFSAGLIACLLEGGSLSQALQQAAACGAMMTMGLGVLDNLRAREEVDLFLKAAAA